MTEESLATIGIDGLDVRFAQMGEGDDILLLHGWGSDGRSFAPIARHLSRCFRVTIPDLPGFGKTAPPDRVWGTQDYTRLVLRFLDSLKIPRCHILGHSFGGRIALRLAAGWPDRVSRLVLVASAGIRSRRTIKYLTKIGVFKTLRFVLLLPPWQANGRILVERIRNRVGSQDYRTVSGLMRSTLVRIVNEDLRSLLSSIQAPVLLVWGSDDTATPARDGRLMERSIPQAKLIVFPGAGHFAHLDRLPQFLRALDSFLSSAKEEER